MSRIPHASLSQHAVQCCTEVAVFYHLQELGDKHRDAFILNLHSGVKAKPFGHLPRSRACVLFRVVMSSLDFSFGFAGANRVPGIAEALAPTFRKNIHSFLPSSSILFALKNASSHSMYDDHGSSLSTLQLCETLPR